MYLNHTLPKFKRCEEISHANASHLSHSDLKLLYSYIRKYDWVLYDVDGTLFDTLPIYNGMWKHLNWDADYTKRNTREILEDFYATTGLSDYQQMTGVDYYMGVFKREAAKAPVLPLMDLFRETIMDGNTVLMSNGVYEIAHNLPWPPPACRISLDQILPFFRSNFYYCLADAIKIQTWNTTRSVWRRQTTMKPAGEAYSFVDANFRGTKVLFDDSLANCEAAISRGWDAFYVGPDLAQHNHVVKHSFEFLETNYHDNFFLNN